MLRSVVVGTVVAAACSLALAQRVERTPHEIAGWAIAYQYKEFESPKTAFKDIYGDARASLFSVLGPAGDKGKVSVDDLPAALYGTSTLGEHRVNGFRPGQSADGKTLWVHFEHKDKVKTKTGAEEEITYRATEIVHREKLGWEIAGGMWSVAVPNTTANEAAVAGKLPALQPVADADTGDTTVIAAFKALFTKGLDAKAAARKELWVLGSAADEETDTGKKLATAWKSAWLKKATVDGAVRVGMSASKKTAWAIANVTLTKTAKDKSTYTIPFRVMVVFDKIGKAWSVVHVHFAVPQPRA